MHGSPGPAFHDLRPPHVLTERPCILTDGIIENVHTTADGFVRIWTHGTARHADTPAAEATLGSGLHAAALVTRFVALLGLPHAAGSDAAA